jgi:hypothetical protein
LNLRMLSMVLMSFVVGCGGGSSTSTSTASAASGGGAAGTVDATALYASLRGGGKLILHQRGTLALTPALLQARVAAMDAGLDAFDGVFLRLPTVSDAVMRNVALDPAAIAAELAPLAGLQPAHLKHNFVLVTAQHDLDAFDNASVVLANFTLLAKAAHDAGLVGLVIDNESASGLRVAFPGDVQFTQLTLADYQVQTQTMGRKLMQTLVAAFPDIAVVLMRGPAVAEPLTPPALVTATAMPAPLLGSFFAGLVEGKGARSLVIDGGDDYGLRIDDQFAASAAWRKSGIASAATNSSFIGNTLRGAWPGAVSVAFGVRETDGANADRLVNLVTVWENTLAAALRHSDTLVWASFDTTDLSVATGAGTTWRVAARRAKAASTTTTARLASTAPGSGSGLMAQYFTTPNQVDLVQTTIDGVIDYDWSADGPTTMSFPQQANYSVIWSGYLEAPSSGTYAIYSTTDDGMRVTIGGVVVIDAFFDQAPTEYSARIDLTAGSRYPIKVEFFQHGGGSRATVEWIPPGGLRDVIPPARLYPVN